MGRKATESSACTQSWSEGPRETRGALSPSIGGETMMPSIGSGLRVCPPSAAQRRWASCSMADH
eukprot:5814862-Alexandrium_andersonii.AAC.1